MKKGNDLREICNRLEGYGEESYIVVAAKRNVDGSWFLRIKKEEENKEAEDSEVAGDAND